MIVGVSGTLVNMLGLFGNLNYFVRMDILSFYLTDRLSILSCLCFQILSFIKIFSVVKICHCFCTHHILLFEVVIFNFSITSANFVPPGIWKRQRLFLVPVLVFLISIIVLDLITLITTITLQIQGDPVFVSFFYIIFACHDQALFSL